MAALTGLRGLAAAARGRSLAANRVAFTVARVLSTKVEKSGAPHPFESFISSNNGGEN